MQCIRGTQPRIRFQPRDKLCTMEQYKKYIGLNTGCPEFVRRVPKEVSTEELYLVGTRYKDTTSGHLCTRNGYVVV